jgi:RNA polymerase sigma-70 factor (ECF subfamily)
MGEKKRPQPLEEATLDRVSATDDPAMILTGKEDLGRVRAAIEGLPARQRMAIALSVEHDLRAPEVAEALGVSVSNVGVLLFRAKARIRSMVR